MVILTKPFDCSFLQDREAWGRLKASSAMQEEIEKEKEGKKAEMARYEKEMEAAARLATAEKERKAAARVKEVERAEKVERSRKETERLLAKQQADIDRKKVRAPSAFELCPVFICGGMKRGGRGVCPVQRKNVGRREVRASLALLVQSRAAGDLCKGEGAQLSMMISNTISRGIEEVVATRELSCALESGQRGPGPIVHMY
jgi:hypothetical protein